MRPIRLTVQGFTSFADPVEIDFSGLDLFAITGPTGSGKTSVLDAMTWALYGKTPRLGSCGTELISHSRDRVAVHFEFAVGIHQYRIARTARRSGAAQVRLEKWCDGSWVPEDASGIRDTASQICKLVGLDFDAFRLSVILPQGKFDQFLRGKHDERRKILKSLLGLGIYDRMREIAHRHCQDHSIREDALRETIDRDFANATNDYLTGLTTELRQQKKAKRENDALLELAQKLCELASHIEANRISRNNKEAERATTESDRIKATTEVKDKAAESDTLCQELKDIERAHDAILIDEVRAQELVSLKIRANQLNSLLTRDRELAQQLEEAQILLTKQRSEQEIAHEAAKVAEIARHTAEESREYLRKKMDELVTAGSADLLERLSDDLRSVAEKQDQANRLDLQAEQSRKRQQEIQLLLSEDGSRRRAAEVALHKAKQDGAELARHDMHRELRAQLKPGQLCPVCEQTVSLLPKVPARRELDAARKRESECEASLQQLREDAVRLRAESDGVPARIIELGQRRAQILARVAEIRKCIHAVTGILDDASCFKALQSKVTAIRQADHACKQADRTINSVSEQARKASGVASKLDRQIAEFAAQVQGMIGELVTLSQEIKGIQPDVERAGGRDKILEELKSVEGSRRLKAELAERLRKIRSAISEAGQKKSEAEKKAAVLDERARSLRAEIERISDSLAKLEADWNTVITGRELPDGETEKQRATSWREQVQTFKESIHRKIAQLEAEAESTNEKIKRVAELKQELEAHGRQRELYRQLHDSLHQNRFIDHLLGCAYTDLCSRGSEHFLQLSGERYSFSAGKNTFNIKDAWNGDAERSAETLSGGESFFASLALALALAESVGYFAAEGAPAARLEALFLDEGISTLDENEALPAVVDALMNLQAGDRMIGVISHMENLAHRLPARIEIVKNHSHSTIRFAEYAAEVPAMAPVT